MLKSIKRYIARRRYAAHWYGSPHQFPRRFGLTFFRYAVVKHKLFYDCMRRAARMQANNINIDIVR